MSRTLHSETRSLPRPAPARGVLLDIRPGCQRSLSASALRLPHAQFSGPPVVDQQVSPVCAGWLARFVAVAWDTFGDVARHRRLGNNRLSHGGAAQSGSRFSPLDRAPVDSGWRPTLDTLQEALGRTRNVHHDLRDALSCCRLYPST